MGLNLTGLYTLYLLLPRPGVVTARPFSASFALCNDAAHYV